MDASAETTALFLGKLARLTSSQQSIQTLSYWVTIHHEFAASLVQGWLDETARSAPERVLLLLYLANDVMQSSRRKCGALWAECFRDAFVSVVNQMPPGGLHDKAMRVLSVLVDREILPFAVLAGPSGGSTDGAGGGGGGEGGGGGDSSWPAAAAGASSGGGSTCSTNDRKKRTQSLVRLVEILRDVEQPDEDEIVAAIQATEGNEVEDDFAADRADVLHAALSELVLPAQGAVMGGAAGGAPGGDGTGTGGDEDEEGTLATTLDLDACTTQTKEHDRRLTGELEHRVRLLRLLRHRLEAEKASVGGDVVSPSAGLGAECARLAACLVELEREPAVVAPSAPPPMPPATTAAGHDGVGGGGYKRGSEGGHGDSAAKRYRGAAPDAQDFSHSSVLPPSGPPPPFGMSAASSGMPIAPPHPPPGMPTPWQGMPVAPPQPPPRTKAVRVPITACCRRLSSTTATALWCQPCLCHGRKRPSGKVFAAHEEARLYKALLEPPHE